LSLGNKDTIGAIVINCKIHGQTEPAILCVHLAKNVIAEGEFIGWVQARFDPKKREPGDLMAWCSECDKIYESDGGWNEQNDSHFKVVCEQCFLLIKEHEQKS